MCFNFDVIRFFIDKGSFLPYDPSDIGLEAVLLALLVILDGLRFSFGECAVWCPKVSCRHRCGWRHNHFPFRKLFLTKISRQKNDLTLRQTSGGISLWKGNHYAYAKNHDLELTHVHALVLQNYVRKKIFKNNFGIKTKKKSFLTRFCIENFISKCFSLCLVDAVC